MTARFTPPTVSADNYAPYEETFTVTVEKSTPTVAGTLTYTLNQTDGTARLPLALAKINSNSAAARNPNAPLTAPTAMYRAHGHGRTRR